MGTLALIRFLNKIVNSYVILDITHSENNINSDINICSDININRDINMTLLLSQRMCVVSNKCNNNNIQVTRRKSTGSYEGEKMKIISQEKDFKKNRESDKDSLGDDKESFSDSDEHYSDGFDSIDGLNFKMIANASKILESQHNLKAFSSKSSSEASLYEDSSDDLESDSEDDFNPELFGLLEDPGVVRFDCVDYPLTVIKHSDDKDQGEATNDWRKEDDHENDEPEITEYETKLLSKSNDSISSINDVPYISCNCHLLSHNSR